MTIGMIVALLFLVAGIIGAVPFEHAYRGSAAWVLVGVAGLLMLVVR